MTEPDKKTTVQKRRTPRHLNSAQKAEAIALWRAGTVTLEELSKKFKRDISTFKRLFAANEVRKGDKAIETAERITAAVEKTIVDDATVLVQRIKDTKEEHYKMAAGISKLSFNLIIKAKQENRPMSSLLNDMKALKLAADIQKVTLEQRYAILGISAEDEANDRPMPDLVIQELTAEDIKAMHAQQMVTDDDGEDMDDMTLGDEELVEPELVEDDRVEVDD